MNTTPFYVTEPSTPSDFTNYIPSIHSVPVKFLGRIINGPLTDRSSIDQLQQKLVPGLNIINKSSFKGTPKLWILQHLFIPRIQWSLIIYEISISRASFLERKISNFIRKWLNIHSSATDISLYSLISPCPLPTKSLTSILKSWKISGHLLLQDSKDLLVSSVSPSLKSGHWKATSATQITEAELNLCQIRGPLHLGRSGLGSIKPTSVPEEGSQAHRKSVAKTHREIEEEHNLESALQLQLQCQWVQWKNYIQNNFFWKIFLAMPPNLLSFCLGATYNVFPSPKNLKRLHLASESRCFLCHKYLCTISYILGACKVSLEQGRFTFRHDSVLQHLVLVLKPFWKNLPLSTTKKCNNIKFVKSATKCSKTKISSIGILNLVSDWILLADVKGDYLFPFQLDLKNCALIFSYFQSPWSEQSCWNWLATVKRI